MAIVSTKSEAAEAVITDVLNNLSTQTAAVETRKAQLAEERRIHELQATRFLQDKAALQTHPRFLPKVISDFHLNQKDFGKWPEILFREISEEERQRNSAPMSQGGSKNPNSDLFGMLSTWQLRDLLQNDDKIKQIIQVSQKVGSADITLLLANITKLCHVWKVYLERRRPTAAESLLQTDLEKAEDESEKLMEEFMDGKLPLETFLDTFQKSRTHSHMRKAQVEKLQELIKRDKKSTQQQRSGQQKMEQQLSAQSCLPAPQNGRVPRLFQLRYGFAPAILIPSEAMTPFPVPSAPPNWNLPPLGSQLGQPLTPRPNTPYSGQGLPSAFRVIGQVPLWGPRPYKVKHTYGPHSTQQQQQHQQPPYR
nr:PREDICTED: vacuolar protein sorting-associated protein 37D [Latimeria chalumnae]|eukprot:XP_005986958.1 PREDICTED: vacuolar protein sorting-associated protein 37D [Latimeria chalumnae]